MEIFRLYTISIINKKEEFMKKSLAQAALILSCIFVENSSSMSSDYGFPSQIQSQAEAKIIAQIDKEEYDKIKIFFENEPELREMFLKEANLRKIMPFLQQNVSLDTKRKLGIESEKNKEVNETLTKRRML
jgi:hypothetical protein